MSDRKVAIINGGTRGIGFQAAEQLLAAGWAVCITGRKPDGLQTSLAALSKPGREVIGVVGRSDDVEHQKEVVHVVLSRWSAIDALINNAATSPFLGDLVDATSEQIQRGFAVNFLAPWSWTKQVYESYLKVHGGAIVNVASIGGTYPVPRVGVYNVTKAALIHMTRQMALEMAPKVRVNAIAPATIKTDFSRAKYEGRETEVAEQYPLKRLGTPEEVGRAIVMLLDGSLGWMTGQTLVLDGGASLIQGVR